jgi:hypothetical protein
VAALSRLIDALEFHTGIPGPVIGRYADKLAEAGHMDDGGDLLPEDAATLIVALAAARAATEAVEAVETYLQVPMVTPAIERTEFAAAQESVVACLTLLLEQIPLRAATGLPGPLTLRIRRSIEEPVASITITIGEDDSYRFMFAPARDRAMNSAWQEWQLIYDELFTAIAELFDGAQRPPSEPRISAFH